MGNLQVKYPNIKKVPPPPAHPPKNPLSYGRDGRERVTFSYLSFFDARTRSVAYTGNAQKVRGVSPWARLPVVRFLPDFATLA